MKSHSLLLGLILTAYGLSALNCSFHDDRESGVTATETMVYGVIQDSSGAEYDSSWVYLERLDSSKSKQALVRYVPQGILVDSMWSANGRYQFEEFSPGSYRIAAVLRNGNTVLSDSLWIEEGDTLQLNLYQGFGANQNSGLQSRFGKIALGNRFSAILRNDTLYGSGQNLSGQLCQSATESILSPHRIATRVAFVAATRSYEMSQAALFYINAGDSLYGCGNFDLLKGSSLVSKHTSPTFIASDVKEVSVGGPENETSIMFIKSDHSLWALGNNQYGQLGSGTFDAPITPLKIMDSILHVSVGNYRSFAIRTDHSVIRFGEAGYTFKPTSPSMPNTQANAQTVLQNVCEIFSAYYYSIAIQCDGKALAEGQLEYGEYLFPKTWAMIATNIRHASGGHSAFLLQNTEGDVFYMNGSATEIPSEPLYKASTWAEMGENHALLLHEAKWYAWGFNFEGEFGVDSPRSTDYQNVVSTPVLSAF